MNFIFMFCYLLNYASVWRYYQFVVISSAEEQSLSDLYVQQFYFFFTGGSEQYYVVNLHNKTLDSTT